ncbi:MAG: hypothetical protein ABFC63_11885 [Thermoguttaceae bacterium]
MLHPLEMKIVALRGRLRSMIALRGLCIVAAIVLIAATTLGTLDWLFRFEDRGLRGMASVGLLALWAWAICRYVIAPLRTGLRVEDLARSVQRRFPSLDDRLLTAIEFLRTADDDPVAGSAALRRAVVARATAEAEPLDFLKAVEWRPTLRAAALMCVTCFAVGLLALVGPTEARIAVGRIARPLGDTTWPRMTNLAIRDTTDRLARGQTFHVAVVDARDARLPADLRIHYRMDGSDGAVIEETERMEFSPGGMMARRENVQQPFAYRIEGGDDRAMPWRAVTVVEPPAVESLAIRATPPRYTGWPATASARSVRALVGTRLAIVGRSTKRLRSIDLCLEGGRRIAGRLDAAGREFSFGDGTLVVERSGAYWFELTDVEGFRGGEEDRWPIQALADAAPRAQIEQPAANLFVTPRAVVPIRVAAQDDLALRNVTLVFRAGDAGPERSVLLWASEGGHVRDRGAGQGGDAGDRRTIEYRWDLSGLELRPGIELTFQAVAMDDSPGTGRSVLHRLRVVSPNELLDRLAAREKLIAAELGRAVGLERACRGQVQSLQSRRPTVRWERADVDQIQAAEHAQRDVGRLLTNRGEGLPFQASALLADLENNRVPGADVQRRMVGLLDELKRLGRELLPRVGRELTAARKTAEADREAGRGGAAGVNDKLASVIRQQEAVIAALEKWLEQLARWDSRVRFHRAMAQLLDEQVELAGRTSDVGRRTLGQVVQSLNPQDAALLDAAAGAETDLAQRLGRTLQEAEEQERSVRQVNPVAADMVADALDAARRLAIGAAMAAASAEIERNQIAQAMASQKQIARSLREVLDILDNRQTEAARLLERLRGAESDLSALEARQAGIVKRIEATVRSPSIAEGTRRELRQLGDEERRLRQETQRLTRQLERLQAERAAVFTRQAVEPMRLAEQLAAKGAGAEASLQAGDARKSLDEARRQLAARVLDATAQLASEQLARLDDAVKRERRRQEKALAESRRLWDLEQSQGKVSRAQAASVGELAVLQRSVREETARLALQLSGADAFQLALGMAVEEMEAAARSLDMRQTGPRTQAAQRRALRQLELVVEAIRPEPRNAAAIQANAGGVQGKERQTPSAGMPSVAELKLLKLLQREINVRVEALQRAVQTSEKLGDEPRAEYRELGRMQGRLAEIVERSVGVQVPPTRKPAGNPNDVRRLAVRSQLFASERQPNDEELRRELGAAAESGDEHPMAQVAGQMREAQQRIERADSGETTQKLQRRIIESLDRLIQQAEQTQGQRPSGAVRSKAAASGQKPDSEPTRGETRQATGEHRGRNAKGPPTRNRMKQLWGELPEHVRERMLQLPEEDFPPQYETLIEDYFRRLAEEKRGP